MQTMPLHRLCTCQHALAAKALGGPPPRPRRDSVSLTRGAGMDAISSATCEYHSWVSALTGRNFCSSAHQQAHLHSVCNSLRRQHQAADSKREVGAAELAPLRRLGCRRKLRHIHRTRGT